MRSLIELSYLLFSGCRAFAELLAYLHCTLSLLCPYTSSAFVPAVASVYASACVIGLTYSARFFFFSLLAFHTEPHFSIGHHAQLLSLAFLQNLSWSLRNFIELHPRSRFLKSLSCFFFFYCFRTSDKPTFCTYPCSQLGSEGGRAEGARRVKSNTESLFYVNAPTTRTQNTRGFFFFAFFTVHRST